MSLNHIDDISQSDEFYSVRSNLSDNSQSIESLRHALEINGNNSMDTAQQIGDLQDKRYDAIYNISQLKHKITDIERHELELMKESTMQHSKLQDNYVLCKLDDGYIRSLARDAATRLGSMKYELKMINEQVQSEHEKLEKLDEQLNAINIGIEESDGSDKEDKNRLRLLIEDQRDQQSKLFEDLEFRELETQSRFEEESEILKRNIIEAQRKSILSSRDRENKKLVLDEQQINLMKDTRKALDQLESERNYYSQQVAYFQYIVNSCNAKIEELNRRLDVSKYGVDQSSTLIEYNWSGATEDNAYQYQSEFNTNQDAVSHVNDSTYRSTITSLHNDSLQDKLDSLTEIVRMNLNDNFQSNVDDRSDLCVSETDRDSLELYQRQCTELYPSTFSISRDTLSLITTDQTHCLKKKPTVTFESMSIGDSISSSQSHIPNSQTKYSITDLNSIMSSNDENCRPGSDSMVVTRQKDKCHNRRSKQQRPLTCFLPKMHSNFNLRQHIESCGHDLTVCGSHIEIDKSSCQGFLWKLSNRMFNVYRKRWFYFDQNTRELRYYTSKSMTKLKGVISFQSIGDVFVDHTHRTKAPQKLSFCIETPAKTFYLLTAKSELVALWVDVTFTGAEAYLSLHPAMVTSALMSPPL